jgi:hypothetical protein
MANAVRMLEIAEVRAAQTGQLLDPEGIGVQIPRQRPLPDPRLAPSPAPAYRLAEEQLGPVLEREFGPDWKPQPRFRAPGAGPKENLGSTLPDWYNERLGRAVEVKRLNLDELGVGPAGEALAAPSVDSVEALERARRQLAAREWDLPAGTEHSIVFNVTGQGVTDVMSVGKRLRTLLSTFGIRYDRVYVHVGSALVEIPAL